jgi:hypothetical protein
MFYLLLKYVGLGVLLKKTDVKKELCMQNMAFIDDAKGCVRRKLIFIDTELQIHICCNQTNRNKPTRTSNQLN